MSVFDAMLHAMTSDGEGDRPQITSGMPADTAIATALLGFAETIAANVDGVLRDIDIEHLHDLRVAARRTRSLIKLTGDVLPGELADRYEPEFKWLGDLTTPTRDLDVFLLEIDELSHALDSAAPGDLDPFVKWLAGRRTTERRKLVRGLRSQRFGRLLDRWCAELSEVADADSPADAGTVEDLAAVRLRKATKRVAKRAEPITADSPAADIHALRKRCKELRYLLEVSEPIYEGKPLRRLIKDLKRVQDVLGSFQDREVQSAGMRAYADEMLDQGGAPAATLLAMGELSASFARQQRETRRDLVDALERYLRPKPRDRIESVLQ